mmetsp:Transcript_13790/g.44142  ORF Transcript_13790/g.44142 Transcript_13790/m.44142 type:complete len:120 (-) Transcript_13790:3186-3545(-)
MLSCCACSRLQQEQRKLQRWTPCMQLQSKHATRGRCLSPSISMAGYRWGLWQGTMCGSRWSFTAASRACLEQAAAMTQCYLEGLRAGMLLSRDHYCSVLLSGPLLWMKLKPGSFIEQSV